MFQIMCWLSGGHKYNIENVILVKGQNILCCHFCLKELDLTKR